MDGALYSAQRRCAEQFRKYNSPADSYEDHSLFLSRRGRYSSLFYLSPTDYAGWAAGLKAAGYATNPRYAEILVGIIERYGLSQYDRMRLVYQYADQRQDHGGIERPVHLCNDIVYVVASRGDSFETIATDTGIKESKLRKFNEVGKDYMLAEGDIVSLREEETRHRGASHDASHRSARRIHVFHRTALWCAHEIPLQMESLPQRLRTRCRRSLGTQISFVVFH